VHPAAEPRNVDAGPTVVGRSRRHHVCRRRADEALACAWAAGVPLALLWLGLTALDGRTYHLAPALIAAAPAIAARLLGLPADRGGVVAATLALAGIITALAAWGLLELAGILPTATLWAGQPGGVRAEIAASAVLGALAGTLASGRAVPMPPPS
jgi:hypothetical protein